LTKESRRIDVSTKKERTEKFKNITCRKCNIEFPKWLEVKFIDFYKVRSPECVIINEMGEVWIERKKEKDRKTLKFIEQWSKIEDSDFGSDDEEEMEDQSSSDDE
jgi:phage FluMu protein Com